MRSVLPLALLAFAAGGLATWVLLDGAGRGLRGGEADSGVAMPAAQGDSQSGATSGGDDLKLMVEALHRRLGRIEKQLSGLVAGPPADRTPVQPQPDLAVELTHMQRAIEELRADVESGFEELQNTSGELHTLKLAKPEPDWEALEVLIREWQHDESTATELVRLMRPADVVRSYGTPTAMWANDQGTHWVYGEGQDAVSGEYLKEVYLKFQDGYVAYVGVALR